MPAINARAPIAKATLKWIGKINLLLPKKLAASFVAGAMAISAAAIGQDRNSDSAKDDRTLSSNGQSERRSVKPLSNEEIKSVIESAKFRDAIARPAAQVKFEHHRILGAPLVQCQISAIAGIINNGAFSNDNLSQAAILSEACPKKRDRKKIRKQEKRNKMLLDALASIGGYYINGTDIEKRALLLGAGTFAGSPLGWLSNGAIESFSKQIEPDATKFIGGSVKNAAIAATISLLCKRDVWTVAEEIGNQGNSSQSHKALVGIVIIRAAAKRQ